MKLKDQVVNLDLAKRLQKLCVKQESLFYWHCGVIDTVHLADRLHDIQKDYSAFTVAELGMLLPYSVHGKSTSDGEYRIEVKKNSSEQNHWISYLISDKNRHTPIFISNSEANGRAATLIYLLENGLMKNENV